MLLPLPENVPSPDQPTNLFVGLRPPRSIAQQMHRNAGELCAASSIIGARRPADILHVSMLQVDARYGRAPAGKLGAIGAALAQICYLPFDIRFDQALSFASRKPTAPFVLTDSEGAPEAVGLNLAIRSSMEAMGFSILPTGNILPHVTIAYDFQRLPRTRVPPFAWRVNEFQLIESWVGRTHYEVLGRWPLQQRSPSYSLH